MGLIIGLGLVFLSPLCSALLWSSPHLKAKPDRSQSGQVWGILHRPGWGAANLEEPLQQSSRDNLCAWLWRCGTDGGGQEDTHPYLRAPQGCRKASATVSLILFASYFLFVSPLDERGCKWRNQEEGPKAEDSLLSKDSSWGNSASGGKGIFKPPFLHATAQIWIPISTLVAF